MSENIALVKALHRMCQPTEPCRLPAGVEDAVYEVFAEAAALDVEALARAMHDRYVGCYEGGGPDAHGWTWHRASAVDVAPVYRAILAEQKP